MACPILTDSSIGTIVRTGSQGTVNASEAGLAVASSIVTKPISCAVIGAGLNGTVVSGKATITDTGPIHTFAVLGAVPWTSSN